MFRESIFAPKRSSNRHSNAARLRAPENFSCQGHQLPFCPFVRQIKDLALRAPTCGTNSPRALIFHVSLTSTVWGGRSSCLHEFVKQTVTTLNDLTRSHAWSGEISYKSFWFNHCTTDYHPVDLAVDPKAFPFPWCDISGHIAWPILANWTIIQHHIDSWGHCLVFAS